MRAQNCASHAVIRRPGTKEVRRRSEANKQKTKPTPRHIDFESTSCARNTTEDKQSTASVQPSNHHIPNQRRGVVVEAVSPAFKATHAHDQNNYSQWARTGTNHSGASPCVTCDGSPDSRLQHARVMRLASLHKYVRILHLAVRSDSS